MLCTSYVINYKPTFYPETRRGHPWPATAAERSDRWAGWTLVAEEKWKITMF